MPDAAHDVDEALTAVRRTLDRLTERGANEPAFEIARAQFAASIRASWPANVYCVAKAIDETLAIATLSLSEAETEELRHAADVLRSVPPA